MKPPPQAFLRRAFIPWRAHAQPPAWTPPRNSCTRAMTRWAKRTRERSFLRFWAGGGPSLAFMAPRLGLSPAFSFEGGAAARAEEGADHVGLFSACAWGGSRRSLRLLQHTPGVGPQHRAATLNRRCAIWPGRQFREVGQTLPLTHEREGPFAPVRPTVAAHDLGGGGHGGGLSTAEPQAPERGEAEHGPAAPRRSKDQEVRPCLPCCTTTVHNWPSPSPPRA